ncbi:MAG: YeiH family protein [Filifactor alocis]|nr:YeiH family protein [Filifactor alocis]
MKKIPGVLICFVIASLALYPGTRFPVVGAPVFAILTAMLLSPYFKKKEIFKEGVAFTSKKILQYSVVLLGFGMNIHQILQSGRRSLPIILSTISIALLVAYLLTKALKLDRNTGILVGVGSSICGGSAIAATAPVIHAQDDEIAKAISVIFLFNVMAALLFPTLGALIGFTNEGFGIFAGTAINDTSSVTAAASAWDALHNSEALGIATVVKLTRTLAIIPITLMLSIYEGRQNSDNTQKLKFYKLVQNFILLFVLASILTGFLPLPKELLSKIKYLSKFMITMAMAAIGLNTDLVKLVKTGGNAILVGFVCWVCITLTSIGMQVLTGLL